MKLPPPELAVVLASLIVPLFLAALVLIAYSLGI